MSDTSAFLVITVALLVGAIAVSAILALWGITKLIAEGYGTMAWGFLAVYIVPLVTIGAYRMFRQISAIGTCR